MGMRALIFGASLSPFKCLSVQEGSGLWFQVAICFFHAVLSFRDKQKDGPGRAFFSTRYIGGVES